MFLTALACVLVYRSIETFHNQESLLSDGRAEHRDFLARIERKLDM